MCALAARNDDWGAQYSFVPRNTLLEPNNVIPSWEFGDEENKEVSATLRRIRQKYDECHKTVLAKQVEFETKKVSFRYRLSLILSILWFSVSLSKLRLMRPTSKMKSSGKRPG